MDVLDEFEIKRFEHDVRFHSVLEHVLESTDLRLKPDIMLDGRIMSSDIFLFVEGDRTLPRSQICCI